MCAFRILALAMLGLLAGCQSPPGVCGNIFDMKHDLSADAGAADSSSPDSSSGAPFAPVGVTISQAACLSFQLSTSAGASGDARRASDLKKITEAGVSMLRGDFLWHRTEKVKGTFDFSGYDRRLKASEAAGVAHIGLLAYGNPWASKLTTSDAMYPPDDPADFAAYTAAAVKHYKGRIKIYEIWNEPNGGYRFWKSKAQGDPKAYGALLKAAYTAAKGVDPSVQVLFGGPFFHDQVIPGHISFLSDVYAAHPDLGKYYDGMALHPYSIYPPGAPPEKGGGWEIPVGEKVAQVRALMAKHGDSNKPLHVTEMGWPVWKLVSEAQQAAYLVRGFLLLLAAGSSSHCWYTLNDSKSSMTPTEGTFGLLAVPSGSAPPREKPAFTAHKVLVQTLGKYRLDQDLAAGEGMPADVHAYGLKQSAAAKRALVIWSSATNPSAVTLSLSKDVTRVTKVTMLGQQSTLQAAGGKLNITPGVDPVYLLEQTGP